MVKEGPTIWREFLQARYGNLSLLNLTEVNAKKLRKASIWWRDILVVGKLKNDENTVVDSFSSKIEFKVGNGNNTWFWHSRWIGDKSLKEVFPVIYEKSTNKLGKVYDLWCTNPQVWKWDLGINREVLITMDGEGLEQLKELEEILFEVNLSSDFQDVIKWWPEKDGIFSVKSCYDRYHDPLAQSMVMQVDILQMLKSIWKAATLSKIQVFGWRVIMNRLPTKDQLLHRGVIQASNSVCVLCSNREESILHLFLQCRVSKKIWGDIGLWFGAQVEGSYDYVFQHFCWFDEQLKGRLKKKNRTALWLAVLWAIWKGRNDHCFKEIPFNAEDVVYNAKIFSWMWQNLVFTDIPFYDWFRFFF
ncbi:uncharacterized protein LOC131597472 [Vicia villosa]|uniref:uncharacterized protein LOC131597472 n=1 Tax=Vicia villosa TaxID=3911 RepID=UPI00273C1BB9|nr:uncharacterized protein LOC131597472 [Vicia villosa]